MPPQLLLVCLGIGCAMGLLAGLLGVGGGIIAIPAMIYFLKMDPQRAMATSLAIIVPVALTGALKHYSAGFVNLQVGLLIAITGIAFSYCGAWLNHHMDPMWLKRIFAIFLLIIAVHMLLDKKPAKAPENPAAAGPQASNIEPQA